MGSYDHSRCISQLTGFGWKSSGSWVQRPHQKRKRRSRQVAWATNASRRWIQQRGGNAKPRCASLGSRFSSRGSLQGPLLGFVTWQPDRGQSIPKLVNSGLFCRQHMRMLLYEGSSGTLLLSGAEHSSAVLHASARALSS